MSTVFILADFSGDKATKTTAELATAGARIGAVTAVVLAGSGKGAALAATINQGPIATVLVIESDDFVSHGVAASADALANLVKEKSPAALLIASHAFGKEVAARVAVLADSGIITDAVDVAADGTATQLVFGGSTTVHSKVSHGVPVITVRPNSVEADFSASSPAIESGTATISADAKKATVSSSQPPVKGGRPELTEANVVARMETSHLLKHLQIHWAPQSVHHELQQMPGGIHIHIRLARLERLSAHSSMSHAVSLARFNIAQECRPLRQSSWSIKILKHRSLISLISA
jgi:electron transfer flavoprotein alpha subunit